jgi:tetratricopeptide (TPR) repeat protein
MRAGVRYRRGWRSFVAGQPSDRDREDLRIAADELDAIRASGSALDAESMVYRATARHWLGDVERARTAYLEAAEVEPAAERALRGLRNLLANDLPRYRADLAGVLARRPDSPAVLFLASWESLRSGDLGAAERLVRRRLDVETSASAGPHVLLAQILRRRGERKDALANYAVGLALDPQYAGLVTEYESYLRERPIRGFDDVDALVSEYRQFLEAGPDDPKFQALSRNNLAFVLRDVAASYTSRGPARLHVFADGAPAKAREVLRLSLRTYEEAAALLPDDVEDLPFRERWLWAGVLNDLGLMLHYFPEIQDLARAEACYLRAFDLTGGAYQDAYFYNLQFLYGFEVAGRDEQWLALAERAKDAILREDPSSPSGFAPDPMKRTAARRDWERLVAKLRR